MGASACTCTEGDDYCGVVNVETFGLQPGRDPYRGLSGRANKKAITDNEQVTELELLSERRG